MRNASTSSAAARGRVRSRSRIRLRRGWATARYTLSSALGRLMSSSFLENSSSVKWWHSQFRVGDGARHSHAVIEFPRKLEFNRRRRPLRGAWRSVRYLRHPDAAEFTGHEDNRGGNEHMPPRRHGMPRRKAATCKPSNLVRLNPSCESCTFRPAILFR